MKAIIDRFEGEFAVVELEDRNYINMPIELVPEGAQEGDVLEIQVNKEVTDSLVKEKEKKWLGLWD